MEKASKMPGFTPDELWITVGTLIAIITMAVLVMNAIRLFREIRKPVEDTERSVQEKLRTDHERLCCLESSTQKQDDELQLLLRSNLVMIHHMVDGNSVQGLKDMQKQIEDYLVFGKTERRI